jgi:alkylation response protein AidB-like acyl-CoA dehydrogenase
MSTAESSISLPRGLAFLLEEISPQDIFIPEDLSEEHLAIGRAIDEFWAKEVEPNLPAIRAKQPGLALEILRRSAKLGLTGISIPEVYGGMEMDLPSLMVAGEHMGRDSSYGSWYSAHTGIGTLPILYFGNEEQKKKYLPKLANVELLAAYALTEPLAGSDALAARTRADLSPDRTHYVLNGQKMWITNGGAADLFTVFAKVGGDKFTAFLVERSFGGVSSGTEEHKMGMTGSSTTAVYFDNVRVPVENVLGEIGRGHIVAFNILNIGRLKLGPGSLGAAKNVLGISLKYAKQRKAFGSAIAEFGAIQHKLAEMAIRIYAAESMTWRVVGLIDNLLHALQGEQSDASQRQMKALEEYAAECSMVKVYASEMLAYVVDEGVQIHGGYGYHQDYAVERSYRDARINRLFEGTNEINRLLITGMLLKRAARGDLVPMTAVQSSSGRSPNDSLRRDEESRAIQSAKDIALLAIGAAYQKYGMEVQKQQEVLMSISDMLMETLAMESALLRSRKLFGSQTGVHAAEMTSVLLSDATNRIAVLCRTVLGHCLSGDGLNQSLTTVQQLASYTAVDTIQLRRNIAARLLAAERYL